MRRLTAEERRRLYRTQQQAREGLMARMSAPPPTDLGTDQRGRARLLTAVGIAALLGVVVLASLTLEFHPPTSLMEALLPRV